MGLPPHYRGMLSRLFLFQPTPSPLSPSLSLPPTPPSLPDCSILVVAVCTVWLPLRYTTRHLGAVCSVCLLLFLLLCWHLSVATPIFSLLADLAPFCYGSMFDPQLCALRETPTCYLIYAVFKKILIKYSGSRLCRRNYYQRLCRRNYYQRLCRTNY